MRAMNKLPLAALVLLMTHCSGSTAVDEAAQPDAKPDVVSNSDGLPPSPDSPPAQDSQVPQDSTAPGADSTPDVPITQTDSTPVVQDSVVDQPTIEDSNQEDALQTVDSSTTDGTVTDSFVVDSNVKDTLIIKDAIIQIDTGIKDTGGVADAADGGPAACNNLLNMKTAINSQCTAVMPIKLMGGALLAGRYELKANYMIASSPTICQSVKLLNRRQALQLTVTLSGSAIVQSVYDTGLAVTDPIRETYSLAPNVASIQLNDATVSYTCSTNQTKDTWLYHSTTTASGTELWLFETADNATGMLRHFVRQ